MLVSVSASDCIPCSRSIHLGAGRDVIVEHEQMELLLALLGVHSGNQHATGLNAHHRARRQVDDGQQGLADQLFRLIIRMDAAEDGTFLAGAVVQGELKQLLALLHHLAGQHLHRAEIGLGEGLEVNRILEQRLDDDLAEVDLLLDDRRSGAAGEAVSALTSSAFFVFWPPWDFIVGKSVS